MLDETGLKPWQRQPGEPRKAFHGFVHYRNMVAYERSLDRAYTGHLRDCRKSGVSPTTILSASPNWKIWKFKYNWEARADAHDAELAEKDRQRRVREIEAMNDRHAALALGLQNQVIHRLNSLAESKTPLQLTGAQMAIMSDRATTIERRARGQPTEILKTEESQGGTPLDLSKLTDEELEVFEKLTMKARS